MTEVDCVVWDFDGVLNANVVDGRFIWSENLEADTGHSAASFQREIFSDVFSDVIRGRVDLLDHVAAWADRAGYAASAATMLDYWFEKDALPDSHMIAIMDQVAAIGLRQVIATNNEVRRAAYIEHDMEFGQRVEAIFSSGRMGCAKPERAFFDNVRNALGVPADRLLLVDDLKANVDAARGLGWKAFHFRDFDYAGLRAFLRLS